MTDSSPDQGPVAPTAHFRMLFVSLMAGLVGAASGVVAYLLYHLIGLVTNVAMFHRFSFEFTSARLNQLGLWIILVPVIGGILVGLMAKYGSEKIKGHGIPEAMEAVLISRSRIEPKVAILKPLSAAPRHSRHDCTALKKNTSVKSVGCVDRFENARAHRSAWIIYFLRN